MIVPSNESPLLNKMLSPGENTVLFILVSVSHGVVVEVPLLVSLPEVALI